MTDHDLPLFLETTFEVTPLCPFPSTSNTPTIPTPTTPDCKCFCQAVPPEELTFLSLKSCRSVSDEGFKVCYLPARVLCAVRCFHNGWRCGKLLPYQHLPMSALSEVRC
eukprot:3927217-Rhodomonas_salina.1